MFVLLILCHFHFKPTNQPTISDENDDGDDDDDDNVYVFFSPLVFDTSVVCVPIFIHVIRVLLFYFLIYLVVKYM